jgi:hypothetical protein
MSNLHPSSRDTIHIAVPDIATMRRRRQSDADYQLKLRVREMEKIRDAHERSQATMAGGGVGVGGGAGGAGDDQPKISSRMRACDLNSEEFQIVCEELWIDFKSWVGHHENLTNCMSKVCNAVVRNWMSICFTLGFLLWFRWYIGPGKNACSFGFGYGIFSFICEILRYLGHADVALFLIVIGACVGLLPLVVGVCVYEFNDAFPDPDVDADADADDSGGDHLKKE